MSIASITRKLVVSPTARMLGFEAFTSTDLWTPAGRSLAFGGQVVAQSLMAASHTVENKEMHSQHRIVRKADHVHCGAAARCLVHAIQDSRTIFILMASFSSAPQPLEDVSAPAVTPLTQEGHQAGTKESLVFDVPNVGDSVVPKSYPPRPFLPKYHTPFPKDITPWGKAPLEEEHWTAYLAEVKERGVDLGERSKAVQDYINERASSPVSIAIARQQTGKYGSTRAIWLKPRIDDGEVLNANTIRSLFGFVTDFQFIGAAARAVGLSATSRPPLGMVASLDHSMHFYPLPEKFDPTAPLLHVMEAAAVDVAAGRGVVRGMLYTEGGDLVATTSQEGAVRAARGGKASPYGTPVTL